jgi:hypothetical protein
MERRLVLNASAAPTPTPVDSRLQRELLMMPCPACGANLPIRPELDTVRCDYCSTQFATPSALRERAAAYLARVRAAWADEIEARWLTSMHASAIKSNPMVMRWLMIFVLAFPFWMIMLGSGAEKMFSPYLVAVCVAFTLIASAGVILGISGPARPPSVALVVASSLGSCRACGGPVPIAEGETACRCRFCGATSVPTPEQKREMLREALQRVAPAKAASLDAYAESLRAAEEGGLVFGVLGKQSAGTISFVMLVVGFFSLIALVIYVVFNVDRPDAIRYEAGWVRPALVVGFAAIVARAVVKARRQHRARAEFETVMGRRMQRL